MRISEIFTSIQGEGSFIGTKAIFIRTFGCRMNCEFCDTPQAKGETDSEIREMSVSDLIVAVHDLREETGLSLVVITGGEPGEQYAELNDLVRELTNRGASVHLETNGEHKAVNYSMFKHVTVCPKTNNIAWDKICLSQSFEFKFLHDSKNPEESIPFFDGIMQSAQQRYGYKPPAIVQILDRGYSVEEQLAYLSNIVNFNSYKGARLLPQLHKLLGIK